MANEKEAEQNALEPLEPIRQSIRRLCAQDQFTWEQSWKSVLSDVTQSRQGLILPDVFQQTLELNEIQLTKKALEAVVEQFQVPNGAVSAHKFLQWINLSRPSDHVDPELVFPRLPQPYRRIMKVLEHDILDAAWATIEATSAKYKAETSAALSARSARSSGLLVHAPDGLASLHDDYTSAKKRCCKAFQEVPMASDGCDTVATLRIHSELPYAALVWIGKHTDETTGLTLQLVHTQRCVTIAFMPIQVQTSASAAGTGGVSNLAVVNASDVRSRAGEEKSRLALAIHVREDVAGGDSTATTDHVLLFEFAVSTTAETTPKLLTSLVFPDPSEMVQTIVLSRDASLLAVTTTKCETTVYEMPPPTESPSDGESPAAPPTLVPLTKIPTDAPASAIYFLNPPVLDAPTRPVSLLIPLRPYAVALIASKCLVKYLLPPPNASVGSLVAKWPHLTSITSSSIDSTSQYVTVGLADGLIVVWDLLLDRDHVILDSSPSSSSPSVSDAVDVAFFCGERFIVSLSLATQRVYFYDIENRAAPTLIRVVTPPPPPSSAASATVEPIRLISLASHSPLLDVPVAMVGYSNGYAMLYDVRNGKAMASLRVAKEAVLTSAPANHAVVALTPSPVVLYWNDLLTTAFPALLTVLQDKRLEATTENVKRVFIASVDTNASSLFLDGASLTVGGKATLHSMLLASAGQRHKATSPLPSIVDLPGTKSSSSLAQMPSNADSRTSLATTASGVGSAPPQEPEPLPGLLECASYPYKPTFGALFERFSETEVTLAGSSGDSKLHRRRNELLKILTAAW